MSSRREELLKYATLNRISSMQARGMRTQDLELAAKHGSWFVSSNGGSGSDGGGPNLGSREGGVSSCNDKNNNAEIIPHHGSDDVAVEKMSESGGGGNDNEHEDVPPSPQPEDDKHRNRRNKTNILCDTPPRDHHPEHVSRSSSRYDSSPCGDDHDDSLVRFSTSSPRRKVKVSSSSSAVVVPTKRSSGTEDWHTLSSPMRSEAGVFHMCSHPEGRDTLRDHMHWMRANLEELILHTKLLQYMDEEDRAVYANSELPGLDDRRRSMIRVLEIIQTVCRQKIDNQKKLMQHSMPKTQSMHNHWILKRQSLEDILQESTDLLHYLR